MRRPLVALVAAATTALGPSAAHAARIAVDQPCYADPRTRADTIAVTGSQFPPGAPLTATVGGMPLPGVTTTAGRDGSVALRVPAPRLPGDRRQVTFLLGLTDGRDAPQALVAVSRLLADFTPRTGDPRTLRVRFRVYGFALGGAVRPTVYLHYADPDGRLRRTVALGVARGGCGRLATPRRRLFGFRARRGTWGLQFDTSATYVKGTSTSPFLFYDLGVKVS